MISNILNIISSLLISVMIVWTSDRFNLLFNRDTIENEEKLFEKSYGKGQYVILTLVIMLCTVLLQHQIYQNMLNWFSFGKLLCLYIIVLICGLVDFRTKYIPSRILVFGIVVRILIYVCEIVFCRDVWKQIVISDMLGVGIGLLLLVVSILSKQSLGYGDVKLFFLIGLYTGVICTYAVLVVSVCLSAIVGAFLMLVKGYSRKDAIPFGPFIAVAYMVICYFGCY